MNPKIIFHPSIFDDMDITQEEIDQITALIQSMVDDGSLFENSRPVEEDDPMYQEIARRLEEYERKLQ
jgi:hypothetical protein